MLTRRAGGAHADVAFLCKLPDAPLDAMLVEVPKWMFDAAHCATLRLAEQPHVDCATLRTLKSSIAEQRVSVKVSVLQPQLSRQAGHGDTDGSVFRKSRITQLALFGERLAVPRWSDLTQPARVEVVRLLAQLLVSVRTSNPVRVPQDRGGRDE